MRSFFIAGSLALSLAGFALGQQDEVRGIVERAIKAHGGEERLKKFQAMRTKTKGKLEAGGGIEFTQDIVVQLPTKFRESMELDYKGKTIVVRTIYNGEKGVIEVDGKKLPLDDKQKQILTQAGNMVRVARLLALRTGDYELSALGEAQVNGKAAVGVRVAKKGLRDVNLYFDKQTGLIAKTESRTVDFQTGAEQTEERIVLEYKTVDDQPLARRVLILRDGKRLMEAEVTEAKQLESVDDSEFALP